MTCRLHRLAAATAFAGLVAVSGFAFAPSDDRGRDHTGQAHGTPSMGDQQRKDFSGKALLGDNIKRNGLHKLQDHGTYSASVNVYNGKITGMDVKRGARSSVSITKYKTANDMARVTASGVQLPSYFLPQSQYVGTMWIGYGFIDEGGDEYTYWFPYGMVDDGDAGAIEYYPAN